MRAASDHRHPLPPEVLQTIWNAKLLLIAVTALPLYEYIITVKQEIDIVWRRRPTLASAILLLTRWALLTGAIMLTLPAPTPETCGRRINMILGPVLTAYVLTATFSALRAFAIWNHSWPVFILVFALGMVPACLQLSLLIHSQVALGFWGQPPFMCNASRMMRGHTNHVYALMTRIPVILAEGIVVLLTWRKTYTGARRTMLLRPFNVASCLLRDGTLYFLAMMALQTVQIAVLFHPTIASLGAFLDTIPPILVGRFIMHLSRLARPTAPFADCSTSFGEAGQPLTSALHFSISHSAPGTWFIGELGADLTHDVLDDAPDEFAGSYSEREHKDRGREPTELEIHADNLPQRHQAQSIIAYHAVEHLYTPGSSGSGITVAQQRTLHLA